VEVIPLLHWKFSIQPSSCHLSLSAASRCALDETYRQTIDPAASSNRELVLCGLCSTRVMIIRFHPLSALCASLLREERYAGSVRFQRQRPHHSVENFSNTFSLNAISESGRRILTYVHICGVHADV
jgi:hypothetical protein